MRKCKNFEERNPKLNAKQMKSAKAQTRRGRAWGWKRNAYGKFNKK